MSTMATLDTIARETERTAPALTYAERRMREGGLEAGMLAGLALDRAAIRDARRAYAEHRARHGYAGTADILTRPDAQPKLGKSTRYALGLMLTPARSLSLDVLRATDATARPVNACPRASYGCERACLAYSGHGAFNATQRARQIRHAFVITNAHAAGVLIGAEIARAVAKHGRGNVTFRFNVLSDYRVEYIAPRALIALESAGVLAYDYTAHAPEDRAPIAGYHLTYSAKEPAHTPDAFLAAILVSGRNVAVPFAVAKGAPLPSSYVLDGHRVPVIDGDVTDDRTTDPREGVIVGLRAKGSRGKRDASGFVRTVR